MKAKANKESFSTIVQSLRDGILVTDREGQVTFMNAAAEGMTGWSLRDATGKPLDEVFRATDEEAQSQAEVSVSKGIQEGRAVTLHHAILTARDGSRRTIDVDCSPIREEKRRISGAALVFRDASKSKEIEDSLRESEEKYRRIVENCRDVIMLTRPDGIITYLSPACKQVLGYEPEDLVGKQPWIIHPDDLAQVKEIHFRALVGESGTDVEYRILTKAGETKWISHSWSPIFMGNDLRMIISTIRDITERKKTEAALRQSEERFRAIFETMPDSIFIKDLASRYTQVNPAMERLFGLTASKLVGRTEEDLFGRGASVLLHEEDLRVLAGENIEEEHTEPMRGVPRTFHVIKAPMRDASGKIIGLCGIARDITDRKRIQEELFQKQKMESLATIAGGVAHSFGNLMTTVLGRASLLREELGRDHSADAALSTIETAATKAGQLARQLLAYARVGEYQPQPMNLNTVLQDTLPLQEHMIPPNIRVEWDLHPSLPDIVGDPTQLQQVLMNLCMNAIEAMPKGGRIHFRTGEFRVDRNDNPSLHGLSPGSYVRLTVRDTGAGMDPAMRRRVSESSFDAKDIMRDLGLAAVHGIVKNHQGIIATHSEVGRGTTFTIYLPIATEGKKNEEPSETAAPGGDETILVIDDEPSVLSITQRILERLGYRVLLARSGEEALEMARSHEGRIHLTLLDLSMPFRTGRETCPQLAALRPETKILLSSGRPLDEEAQRLLDAGAQDFVQKPYTLEILARRIREVLDSR